MTTTTTTRRNLLAGLPAVVAIGGMQNEGAAVDPIFAALDAYRRADKAYGDAGDLPGRHPIFVAAEEAYNEATTNLEATKPVTMAGCIALLQFTVDDMDMDGSLTVADWHAPVMRGVLEVLQRLAH